MSEGDVKLHLGCGPKHIEGFVHVDALDYPHVDHVGRVDDLTFIEDGTVTLIYASHVLEHFGRHEYQDVLREWYRVLKPGGVLRLGVPDFGACARLYADGQISDLEMIRGLICGGQKDEYDYHKIIFDEKSLSSALHDVGYSETRLWDWRETEHAEMDDFSQAYIPHMAKDTGTLVSLNMEAVK